MGDGKVCSTCKEAKPYSEFHRCKQTRDGYKYSCKDCTAVYHREHLSEAAIVKRRQTAREWNQVNRELIEQRRKANPEIHRASRRRAYRKDPQKYMQQTRAWVARKPAQRRSHIHKQRARIEDPGQILQAEWDALMEECGGRCACCGTTENICMDHIVPLSKGGENRIGNIQPLCLSCNAKKATKSTDYRRNKKAA